MKFQWIFIILICSDDIHDITVEHVFVSYDGYLGERSLRSDIRVKDRSIGRSLYVFIHIYYILVGGLEDLLFFQILGTTVTHSIIFQRGRLKPPTSFLYIKALRKRVTSCQFQTSWRTVVDFWFHDVP